MGTRAGPADALEELGRTPAGLITWFRDGDDVVGGHYRIRNTAPFRWTLEFREGAISEHHRLSSAQVAAGLHHRRVVRKIDLIRWSTIGAAAIVAALILMGHGGPSGILGSIGGLSVFLVVVPRFVAALTGNLLDPYRRRDPWEPADWWNRNP